MICTVCDRDLAHCICAPVSLGLSPLEVVQVVYCSGCGKHVARCECEAPVLEPRSAA